jgi:hypothetical protein
MVRYAAAYVRMCKHVTCTFDRSRSKSKSDRYCMHSPSAAQNVVAIGPRYQLQLPCFAAATAAARHGRSSSSSSSRRRACTTGNRGWAVVFAVVQGAVKIMEQVVEVGFAFVHLRISRRSDACDVLCMFGGVSLLLLRRNFGPGAFFWAWRSCVRKKEMGAK